MEQEVDGSTFETELSALAAPAPAELANAFTSSTVHTSCKAVLGGRRVAAGVGLGCVRAGLSLRLTQVELNHEILWCLEPTAHLSSGTVHTSLQVQHRRGAAPVTEPLAEFKGGVAFCGSRLKCISVDWQLEGGVKHCFFLLAKFGRGGWSVPRQGLPTESSTQGLIDITAGEFWDELGPGSAAYDQCALLVHVSACGSRCKCNGVCLEARQTVWVLGEATEIEHNTCVQDRVALSWKLGSCEPASETDLVSTEGSLLRLFPNADHQVVLAAVAQDGCAIQFADVDSQAEPQVFLHANTSSPAECLAVLLWSHDIPRGVISEHVVKTGLAHLALRQSVRRCLFTSAVQMSCGGWRETTPDCSFVWSEWSLQEVLGKKGLRRGTGFVRKKPPLVALLGDERVMEEALALHGALMLYAPSRIRDNEILVEIAMSSYPEAIKVCSHRLRSDYCFMRRLLLQHGSMWLRYAGRQLRDNTEFVLDLMKHAMRSVRGGQWEQTGLRMHIGQWRKVVTVQPDVSGFKYSSHRVRSDQVIAQWILARTRDSCSSCINWGVTQIPLATQVRAEFVYGNQMVQELTWAALLVNWLCEHGRAEPKQRRDSKWLWWVGRSPIPIHVLEKIMQMAWPVRELIRNAHGACASLKAGTWVDEPGSCWGQEKVRSRLQLLQPGASAICTCNKAEYPCRKCDNSSADAWIAEHVDLG